jgi:Zn-dependent protease with chaperone function
LRLRPHDEAAVGPNFIARIWHRLCMSSTSVVASSGEIGLVHDGCSSVQRKIETQFSVAPAFVDGSFNTSVDRSPVPGPAVFLYWIAALLTFLGMTAAHVHSRTTVHSTINRILRDILPFRSHRTALESSVVRLVDPVGCRAGLEEGCLSYSLFLREPDVLA